MAIDYSIAPAQAWEKMFDAFQFLTFENAGRVLPYRFYQPNPLEGEKVYPLVLLMHGAGERGVDNRHQLENFGGISFWEKYPCFILAPQCPLHEPGEPQKNCVWVGGTSFAAPSHTTRPNPEWSLQLVMKLLEASINKYPVDLARIYVTGLSMGAFALGITSAYV